MCNFFDDGNNKTTHFLVIELSFDIFDYCPRAVDGVDGDPNLVHIEIQDSSGGKHWCSVASSCFAFELFSFD